MSTACLLNQVAKLQRMWINLHVGDVLIIADRWSDMANSKNICRESQILKPSTLSRHSPFSLRNMTFTRWAFWIGCHLNCMSYSRCRLDILTIIEMDPLDGARIENISHRDNRFLAGRGSPGAPLIEQWFKIVPRQFHSEGDIYYC